MSADLPTTGCLSTQLGAFEEASEPLEEACRQVVTYFDSGDGRKQLDNLAYELGNKVVADVKESLARDINQEAAERAEKFLLRVLDGSEDAAKALFDCGDSSRYEQRGAHARRPWPKVYSGSLFQSSSASLRQRLVAAHADLLKTERIKDLEATVEGLRKQIVELEERKDGYDH